MKRKQVEQKSIPARHNRPDMSLEARQNALISKSYDEAERRIDDGTASDGLLVQFLKLGTTQARLEEQKTRAEVLKLEAQAQSFKSTADREKAMKSAIAAFTKYSPGRTYDESEIVLVDE